MISLKYNETKITLGLWLKMYGVYQPMTDYEDWKLLKYASNFYSDFQLQNDFTLAAWSMVILCQVFKGSELKCVQDVFSGNGGDSSLS